MRVDLYQSVRALLCPPEASHFSASALYFAHNSPPSPTTLPDDHTMKIKINNYHAIALWRWNLQAGQPPKPIVKQEEGADPVPVEEEEEDEGDDDDDVCGICRVAYDGCCPDCKTPGDECPLIWGECTHVFHMHCLVKWINTESSKSQCPMDRRIWVTAGAAAADT